MPSGVRSAYNCPVDAPTVPATARSGVWGALAVRAALLLVPTLAGLGLLEDVAALA